MANKDEFLTEYRSFFLEFANTVEPNDQLPVKLGSYKFFNSEVVGGIVDWGLQYLNRKSCPSTLIGPLIKITIDEIRQACKKNPVACGFNPNENVYEPLKLMQTVMSKVNEICLRYLDNSQLDTLPSPSTVKPPKVSFCATRNTRRRMEDRHIVIHDLHSMFNIPDSSPASYYGIFDGHAGSDAASYSAAHLHQYLMESPFYPTEPEAALKESFLRTDECFLEKSRIENFRSGTTAVCALLRPKQETLYVAWVGDSQALLVNRGKVLQIVKPHKPCREDEKDRIEANGGCVMFWGMWRVNGQLAVSRAIGDLKLKPYVTAEPDIVAVPLDGNEEFLIMACDGLWDFVSEDDAAIAVYKRIKEDPENIENIAESLSDLAKQEGSRDNISIIIIFLKDPIKIAKNLSTDCGWLAAKPSDVAMETGVDNVNNTASNNFDLFDVFQKRTLDPFNDEPGFKPNGNDEKNDLFLFKTNGKRPADFDDEDLGPETDVDAVVEKEILNTDLDVQRAQSSEFEPIREQREETPTPPADSVLDSSIVTDNVAESEESEDEWNYYKVDQKETQDSLPLENSNKVSSQVASCPDEMSQLNPDAKEFVPVSPTRVSGTPSPFPRDLGDELIAQSPRRALPMDINVPTPNEFQCEVKQRPSELFEEFDNQKTEQQNGHQLSSQEIMQNLLNENQSPSDENPTNSSLSPAQDEQDFTNFISKPQDPMSMSFYQDKNEDANTSSNPFDLNKVQVIPDNIDEFIQNEKGQPIKSSKEGISPPESPLGVPLSPEIPEMKNSAKETTGYSEDFKYLEQKNAGIQVTKSPIQVPKSPTQLRNPSPERPGFVEGKEFGQGIKENAETQQRETKSSPILEIHSPENSPIGPLSPKSPIPELTGLVSPDITASIKDDNISGEDGLKSPIQDLEDIKSPTAQEIEERQKLEQLINEIVEENTVSENVQELLSDAIQDIVEMGTQLTTQLPNKIAQSAMKDNNSLGLQYPPELGVLNCPDMTSIATDVPIQKPPSPVHSPLQLDSLCAVNSTAQTVISSPVLSPVPKSPSPAPESPSSVPKTPSPIPESLSSVPKSTSPVPKSPSPVQKPIEIVSPVSPIVEEVEKFQTETPENWKQNLEIKTEIIKPEFAVPIIASPCDDSKGIDTPPTTPAVETLPAVVEKVPQPAKLEPKKSITKKLSPVATTKTVVGPSLKSTNITKKALTPTTTKPSATAKPSPTTKPLTPRAPITKPSTPPIRKPLSNGEVKPIVKTTIGEVKPLVKTTNGEVKPLAKPTSLVKKTATTTNVKPTTPTSKPSSAKPLSRPATATRQPPKTTTAPAPRSASATTRPKPATVAPKTTAAPPRAAPRPATTVGTKSTTTLKPKPTSGSVMAKPRVPLTAAAKPLKPDAEKLIKETANKQISATKTTTNRTITARNTTTVKKTEAKGTVSSMRTTTTTKTSTTKPIAKKSEVTKTTITKTTKTVGSKPQENGVVVIQGLTATTTAEPPLLKDNSPSSPTPDNQQLIQI